MENKTELNRMRHVNLLLLLIICLLIPSFFCYSELYSVYDSQEFQLPRNFRTTLDVERLEINIKGLHHLRVSGSEQFSKENFRTMIHSLSLPLDQLIILDLREESHGFVNGIPISWTDGENFANVNKIKDEIESDEIQRLNLAVEAQQITIDRLEKSHSLVVYTAQTEQDLVIDFGARYIRLPVTDHKRPTDETVDHFIQLIKEISPDDWIHVHCKGGRGRTTTFFTLFDIAANSLHVSLEDILVRQFFIGGVDLTQIEKVNSQRTQCAKERLEFIQQFYLYCQQVPNFQISWSDWLAGVV